MGVGQYGWFDTPPTLGYMVSFGSEEPFQEAGF
jgi:hypothetical protein